MVKTIAKRATTKRLNPPPTMSREIFNLFQFSPKVSQQRHLLSGQQLPALASNRGIPGPSGRTPYLQDTWDQPAFSGAQGPSSFPGTERSPLPSQHKLPRGWPVWSGGPDPDHYLGLDDLLWEVAHGIGQPAFQALGKVADGLCQGTWGHKPWC